MSRSDRPSAPVRICTYDLPAPAILALNRLLMGSKDHQLAGHARSESHLERFLAERKPDLLLVPPSVKGLRQVERLMATAPLPIAAVTTETPAEDRAQSMLAAGTLEILTLPDPDSKEGVQAFTKRFRQRLLGLARARVIHHPRGRLEARKRARKGQRPASQEHPRIVAICSSTGGPESLARLLGPLPRSFDVPIVLVQHLSSQFVDNFAKWLGNQCSLQVRIAEGGERPQPGVIHIAPSDIHLTINREGKLHLTNEINTGSHIPSGDVLLESVASRYGRRAVGIILSGMGDDGVTGLARIKERGGFTMSQDEESAVVWGMPREAVRRGATRLVLPADEIAAKLIELAGKSS